MVTDDVDVMVNVVDLNRGLKEIHDVGGSSGVVEHAHVDELIDNRFGVDWLIVGIELLHRFEDEDVAWIFAREVFLLERGDRA